MKFILKKNPQKTDTFYLIKHYEIYNIHNVYPVLIITVITNKN